MWQETARSQVIASQLVVQELDVLSSNRQAGSGLSVCHGGQMAELARRAEAGEEIVFTRHGRPAARLVPAMPPPDERARRALIDSVRAAARHRNKFFQNRHFSFIYNILVCILFGLNLYPSSNRMQIFSKSGRRLAAQDARLRIDRNGGPA